MKLFVLLCSIVLTLMAPTHAKDDIAARLPNVPHDSLSAEYGVHWGALRIAELTLGWTLQDAHYNALLRARTRGVLRAIFRANSAIDVFGKRDGDALLANRFSTRSRFNGKVFERDMTFAPGGAATITHTLRPEDFDIQREPVPARMMRGPDPISALVESFLYSASRDGVTSFDGVQVLETRLTCDAEPDTLKKTRRSSFYGEAQRCSITGDVLAGDVIEDEKVEDEEDIDGRTFETLIWFAKTRDGAMRIPVRIFATSERGTLKIYLRSLSRLESS